jgi:purine-binding chemotaxis protein CheW
MDDTPRESDFSALVEDTLRRRAQALALATGDSEVSEGLSLLLFRIADEWYAVEAGDVREIFQGYEVTPIPCVPDFVLGVVTIRGEILSVPDPARMMQLGSIGRSGEVEPPAVVIANDAVATALVVDEIGDIVEVANGAVEPPVSIIDRAQAEFVVGSLYVGGRMVGLLNVERVLEPIGS